MWHVYMRRLSWRGKGCLVSSCLSPTLFSFVDKMIDTVYLKLRKIYNKSTCKLAAFVMFWQQSMPDKHWSLTKQQLWITLKNIFVCSYFYQYLFILLKRTKKSKITLNSLKNEHIFIKLGRKLFKIFLK